MTGSLRRQARLGHPVWSRLACAYLRCRQFRNLGLRPFARALRWYLFDRGIAYSYEITPAARAYLVRLLADLCNVADADVEAVLSEIESDAAYREAVRDRIAATGERYFVAPDIAPGGKRLAWYAMVRLFKPRVVVEAGIDRGLATAIMARALERNSADGAPGRLHALDIHPDAGALVPERLRPYVEFRIGDSLEILRGFEDPIDLLIHDSFAHETEEYGLALDRLSPGGLIVSGEAATSLALLEFARANDLDFRFWREDTDHPYGGRGMGIARRR